MRRRRQIISTTIPELRSGEKADVSDRRMQAGPLQPADMGNRHRRLCLLSAGGVLSD